MVAAPEVVVEEVSPPPLVVVPWPVEEEDVGSLGSIMVVPSPPSLVEEEEVPPPLVDVPVPVLLWLVNGQTVIEVTIVEVVIGCLAYGQSVFVDAQVEMVTMLVTNTVLVCQPRAT